MSEGAGGLIALAVDDEAPALAELAHLLAQDPRIARVRTAGDAGSAWAVLREPGDAAPDVVFLDINMPGLDGMDLAQLIATLPDPPQLVFVTAHDERAVQAYEVGAIDYVLKPIRPARLAAAVERVGRRVAPPPGGVADETIAVELAGSTRLVMRSAVCWVEAQGDYARLHLTDGTSHLWRIPLTTLQERWDAAGFVRVHRGALVDLARITQLRTSGSGASVLVSGGPEPVEVQVSRRHLKALKGRLFDAVSGAVR